MAPQLIAGRYRVERELGRGGMGAVWLCRDEMLGREVAVKQIGALPGEAADLARGLREARSSAALQHPNVVSVFDAVDEGETIWLVMEYVPSRTLSQLAREEGPLDPRRAAAIGAQVADGLALAHERGTVHRDVKPGNVLVAEGDHAKISDFGIARSNAADEHRTQTGLLTGTPAYFSPELARGADSSPASDVWALGATLYAAVEGRQPYAPRENAIATLAAIAQESPEPPRRAGALAGAIGHMLDPDPEVRWSMAQVAR
uniref:serine/threonine-protein kinase n=1 Tax=Nocardioides salarius TaxID=374513 RepID=UPI0030FC5EFE